MNANAYEKLGNYRLVQRLGIGGFSTVYLGEHLFLKTLAAVKVLHSRLFSDEALTSFLQEARLVEQLDHPHIVRLLEFGVEEHAPYLVFQYAPNGTVRQRSPRGSQIALPIIVQYVRQIAEALQYAHDLKIIHRDIKPENFLLGKENEILLGDFGLAIPSRSSANLLDRDRGAGTAEYMAPEQSLGKSSRASDQYGLGIVVYEWLCGHPPFRGADYEVLHKHIHDTPPSLQDLVPTVPAAIEQVVMRALAKKPSERFPQVQDFARALAAAYYQSLARQTGAAVVLPGAAAVLEASSSGQEAAPSQEQPQSPGEASLAPAHRDDQDGVQQQGEQASDLGSLAPSSVSSDEQATDPATPAQKLAAVVDPVMQKRRMSRRSILAAGILGLVGLGGGAAAWYLFDSSISTPAHRARTAPGGTSQAGGVGGGSTSSPSPTPGSTATPTTAPLTLRIGNAGALARVRVNSTNNVVVRTSQPGIPVTVRVAYSNGNVQTLGLRTTNGNGDATFAWRAHPNGSLGKLPGLSATLVASVAGVNRQKASSAPVTVTILHHGSGPRL